MQRARRRKKNQRKRYVNYLYSAVTGIIVIILCLIGFSAIISKIGVSGNAVSALANISLCIGSFVAGLSIAKKNRKNGIISGLLCGLIIYALLYFLGTIILRRFAGISLFTKLILIAICSALGGIVGVNTKIRRPPS